MAVEYKQNCSTYLPICLWLEFSISTVPDALEKYIELCKLSFDIIQLYIELSDGSTIGGMLFADDFVGVSNSEEELQRLTNVAHAYCKWRLKANVSKSAVVVFARELVEGSWNWGEQALPKYTYLGVDFTSNGAWDEHVKRVLQNGRKKIISNRDIDLTARRLLLISVVRPTLEYGGKVIRLRQQR